MSHVVDRQKPSIPSAPDASDGLLQLALQACEAAAAFMSIRGENGLWRTWSSGLHANEISLARQMADVHSDRTANAAIGGGRTWCDGGHFGTLHFCASARHVSETGCLVAELTIFDRQERLWTPAHEAALRGFVQLAASRHGHEPAQQHVIGDTNPEELCRAMFKDNPRPLIVYDVQTLQVLTANSSALKLYGYDAVDLRRLAIPELWAPSQGEEAGRQQEDAVGFIRSLPLQQPTDQFRCTHVHKDGLAIDVELSSTPLTYDGAPARLLHILDLTREKDIQRLAAQASRTQRMRSRCNEALVRAGSQEELLQCICQVAVEVGG